MKTIVLMLVAGCLILSGCGGSGSGAPSANPTPTPAPTPTPEPVDLENPRVAFDAVAGLKTLADFPIGMEVSAADQERSIFTLTEQQPVLNHHFNSLVAGVIMKMKHLHPEENTYTFDDADALVDYALANDMLMHGHTLIWHWESEVPEFMKSYSGDWDAMMQDHVSRIVEHFAGRVTSWDVVNEAIDYDYQSDSAGYRDSLFYQNMGPDYIENAFLAARAADSQSQLYYNDFGLSDNGAKLDFTLTMLEDFIERNIPVDGVGFQMHITLDAPSAENIQAAFERAAALGLNIKITELDVAVNLRRTEPPAGWAPSETLTIDLARQQKARYREVVAAYLAGVPQAQRAGITIWGLVDGETWMRSIIENEFPLIFFDDYTVKPAYYGIAEALSGQ